MLLQRLMLDLPSLADQQVTAAESTPFSFSSCNRRSAATSSSLPNRSCTCKLVARKMHCLEWGSFKSRSCWGQRLEMYIIYYNLPISHLNCLDKIPILFHSSTCCSSSCASGRPNSIRKGTRLKTAASKSYRLNGGPL